MENLKKCPFCAEEIAIDAKKCKFCGEFLDKTTSGNPANNDSKNHSSKLVFYIIIIISILALLVIVISVIGKESKKSIIEEATKARDSKRQSDMSILVSAQEMYYSDNNKYYALATMPTSISTYLTTVPVDPTNISPLVYTTIDNTGDATKFCYYAKLEAGGYYTASHNGRFKKDVAPKNLADCATETKVKQEIEATPKQEGEGKAKSVPTEYKSALNKAALYSSTMQMSKLGVYNQLVSEYGEKFSEAAAQYAIDNVKADWNANALAKAKTYQDTMNMSPAAIRDQLTSEYGEKFTQSEADYAMQHLDD
jgi:hypothetical protein